MKATLELRVAQLDCADEARQIESALARLDGIGEVRTAVSSRTAVVAYDPERIKPAAIRAAITDLGMTVTEGRPPEESRRRSLPDMLGWAFVSAVAVVALVSVLAERLGFGEMLAERIPPWISIAAVLAGGYPIFRNVVRTLRNRTVTSHALMTLGITGALVIHQYSAAAVIVFFMRFADFVEGFTTERSRRAIKELLKLAPDTARVEREGTEREVPADQLSRGDIVLVKPGERIPVDGVVLDGSAAVNQAPITGESDANDLQARITAAIQSGTGPDIIQLLHNWPHLYQNALADMSDLCEWKARDQGGFYPQMEAAARVGKRWLALPYGIVPGQIAYRKSWFAEVGAMEPPKTLEEYRKLGTALKKKGKPLGQTLGHTFGDAPGWTYPMVWTFGAAETDPSGKKVVLNSKVAVESVKWMAALWKDACDEGALAWDDTNNNRAFHAGEISATLNGASIYIFAKRNPDKIKDDKGQPMWQDISHFPIPDGPLGRTPSYQGSFSHAVMKYSRNQAAAKEFLKWLHAKEQFGKWFEIEFGYTIGATTFWENHPLWQRVDDALKPFRIAAHGSRMFGYAGPPSAKAAEAYSKYIITDMYAKAAQGMTAEDAVKWADGELKKIYEG